jgi:hypothetical protein
MTYWMLPKNMIWLTIKYRGASWGTVTMEGILDEEIWKSHYSNGTLLICVSISKHWVPIENLQTKILTILVPVTTLTSEQYFSS